MLSARGRLSWVARGEVKRGFCETGAWGPGDTNESFDEIADQKNDRGIRRSSAALKYKYPAKSQVRIETGVWTHHVCFRLPNVAPSAAAKSGA